MWRDAPLSTKNFRSKCSQSDKDATSPPGVVLLGAARIFTCLNIGPFDLKYVVVQVPCVFCQHGCTDAMFDSVKSGQHFRVARATDSSDFYSFVHLVV